MSNLWDIPQIPTEADENIDDIYTWVGRITSEWEGLEVGLSRIYSFFVFKPDDHETIRKYGEGTIFINRFADVQKASQVFFISHPDQNLEGEFHQLFITIKGFSDRRNDVAHDIVNPVQFYPWYTKTAKLVKPQTNYWALIPPYHTFKKYAADNTPTYVYTSASLRILAMKIQTLYGEITSHREHLRDLIG